MMSSVVPRAQCRTGRLFSLRCKDRRCIPKQRAAADILPLHVISTLLICSHSNLRADNKSFLTGAAGLPLCSFSLAIISSASAGFVR